MSHLQRTDVKQGKNRQQKKKKNNHKQSQGLEAENDQDFIH